MTTSHLLTDIGELTTMVEGEPLTVATWKGGRRP